MDIEDLKCCGNCKHVDMAKRKNSSWDLVCLLSEDKEIGLNGFCHNWEFDKLDIFERLKKIK